MPNKQTIYQLVRFCVVGLGNTAVDFSAFFLLTLGGTPYLLAQFLSYSLGIANSYYFNRSWTFRVAGRTNLSEITRFILLNGFSLAVSSAVLFILFDQLHVALWIAKLIATGCGIGINFMGSRIWVFTQNRMIEGGLYEN